MGGAGALNIFMSNDSFFLAAGSMSGILDIRKFPKQWEISRVLGNYNKKNSVNWDHNTAMENLNKIKSREKCRLIIDCGTEDFAYPVNVQFKEKAEKMGINIIFDSRKGIHDWTFWKDALINHLRYFKSLCKF